MKYLKQLFSLIIIGFLAFSCNQNERSVGFNDWTDDGTEYKFYLGTDASVDVVKGYNDNWTSRKYEDENGIDTWNSINRYYVIDGKVVWWNTFNQDIIDPETQQ